MAAKGVHGKPSKQKATSGTQLGTQVMNDLDVNLCVSLFTIS